MFCSQRPAQENKKLLADNGPMIYIANAMTPFSPEDVTVYSNCDQVRLTFCKEGEQLVYTKSKNSEGMPSPIITFKNVWDVMHDKSLSRNGKQADSYLLAEGLVNGEVVATHKVVPARRPSKLLLWIDDEKTGMIADGTDMATIIAAVADENGNIKRLNNCEIQFEIEGPGQLIANEKTFTNPRAIQWGTAPILIRTTTRQGNIKYTLLWYGKESIHP